MRTQTMRCVVTDELSPPPACIPMSQACFIHCGDFHYLSTQHHAATTSQCLSLTTHLSPPPPAPPHTHTSLRAATVPYRNLLEHRYIIGWHESSCDNDYRMESSCDNDYRMESSFRKTIPKPTQELLLYSTTEVCFGIL